MTDLPILTRTFPEDDRDEYPIRQNSSRSRVAMRQTHRHRGPWRSAGFSQVHEVADAADSCARQNRTSGLRRSPHGGRKGWSQRTWCTTRVRSVGGCPSGEPEETPNGSGYGRSSAEAVAALGTAGLENCTSGTGAHARTKTVLAGFTSIVGLKGALHGASSVGQAPWGARGLCGFPAPAARDESIHRLTPPAGTRATLGEELCDSASRFAQFGVSTGSDYGLTSS